MDGQLPSIPSPTGSPTPPPPMGAAPAPHPGFTPALPGAGVRGRPSNDPDQQVAREVRANERRRIESLLPKAATDSKIRVFRLKEGQDRPAAHAKHALMVLMSELEEVKNEQGIETNEYIREKLVEKYGDEGRFVCQAYDRDNRMLGIPSWEINLDPNAQDGDDDEEEPTDNNDDAEAQQQADDEERQRQAQQREEEIRQAAQRQALAAQEAQKPPPAPATDATLLTAIIGAMNNNKGPDTAAIMAQMQQQNTQMIVAMMQQQTTAQQAAAEREEKRRAERTQTLMTLLPLLLPIVKDTLFAPKKEGLDPATMILIETLKNQNAANPATSMISVMAEMAKAQSQLQSQAAAGAVEMQGQMTSMVMGQMMSTLKDAMNMKANLPAAEKEDSTMDMLAKVALPLIAGYAAQRQQAQGGPSPEELAQQAPATPPALPAPAPAAPAPAPPRARPPAPAAPAAAAPTDDERIYRCLETIMRLSNGAIPANQRWDALEWCSANMPPRMLAAIRTNREDDVLSMGSGAVASHPDLLEWFGKDGSIDFLKGALNDIRLQALKQTTPDYVAKAVMLNQAFVDKHYPKPAKPAPAPKPAPVVEPPKPAPAEPAAVVEPPKPAPPAGPPPAAEPKTVEATVVPPETPAPAPKPRAKPKG